MQRYFAFLDQRANPDGSFIELYQLAHDWHHKGYALTAFVLLTYIEAGYQSAARENAIRYLEQSINTIEQDSFSLAMVSYVLKRVGSEFSSRALDLLERHATSTDTTKYWSPTVVSGLTSGKAVETTAYALLAYLESGRMDDTPKILHWLLSQRNPTGGFVSTQVTEFS